jgi:hypothetical protein
MKEEKIEKIFEWWQNFVEFADKFSRLMLPIPDSFFAYSTEEIEGALNIIAKVYFDSGDYKTSEAIQETMIAYLSRREEDEKALKNIKERLTLFFENPKLKKTMIKALRESKDFYKKRNNEDSK